MDKIYIDLNVPKAAVDEKIFGHFCEHAFGNIYGGFYDPDNKNSDKNGYRLDVLEALKEVAPTIMRYPGGNFVSNYHWEDGIGPKDKRKKVFEYAWLTEESNQFGTADFIEICRMVGAEPLICVNMGTGTIEEAMHWVEYCNGRGDTYYANLRRAHGYEEPFSVKYWGLGNESYGPWQMNNYTPDEYVNRAFQFAKAMRWADPTIKLIANGYEQRSEWAYAIGNKLWQTIDYVSAHHYSCGWGPFHREKYLETMCIADYMDKLNKLTYSSLYAGMNNISNCVKVAWDEWNMNGWAIDGVNDDNTYTLHDALVTALVFNMFIRNADTVGIANYSTFVNISGALSVNPDGIVMRAQYPVFKLLRHNTGKTLYESKVVGETFSVIMPESEKLGREPIHIDLLDMKQSGLSGSHTAPYIDAAVTMNDDGTVYVSIINKHESCDKEVYLNFFKDGNKLESVEAFTVYNDDIKACNTKEHPGQVGIKPLDLPRVENNGCKVLIKKHSINMLKFKVMD